MMFRGQLRVAILLTFGVSWTPFAFAQNDWDEAPVDCTDPSTLWEEYVCQLETCPASLLENSCPEIQEKCHPRYILQTERLKPKGLIVVFHGYTACPDSFESMVEAWVPAGYTCMMC